VSPETDEVIKIDQVHPGLDVFAGFRKHSHASKEKHQGVGIAVRGAADHVVTPLIDLPLAGLEFRIYFQPIQDFAIPFPGGEFIEQRIRIKAEKIDDVLVERRVVSELSVPADDRRPSFVEHPWKSDETTESTAWRTGRAQG